MAAPFRGICARRPCGRTPIGPEPHTAPTPDRSFAPVSACRRGSALAPLGCMRSTIVGSIDHGSDGDSTLRAVPLAAEPTPAVNLEQMEISELAVRLVPERLARRHLVVPIRLDNRTLTYGDLSAVRRRGGARSLVCRRPAGGQRVRDARVGPGVAGAAVPEAAGTGTDRRPPARGRRQGREPRDA